MGWLVYVHAWRDTGARPLSYRDETAQLHVEPIASFVRRFRNADQLAEYVRRNGRLPPPRIDFRRNEAVLAAAGPRSSTGYAVQVVRAVEEHGRVLIVVRERSPTLRNPGRARLAYPYRLLVFARTAKPVYVEWLGRP